MSVFTFPTIRRKHPWLLPALIGTPARVIIAYALYSVILLPHVFVRGIADNLGMPRSQRWILGVERFEGFGETPTQRLQDLLFHGRLTWFEWIGIGSYFSFFFVPLLLVFYVAVVRPRLILSFLFCIAAAFYVADVLFFFFPTEPPWMALDVPRILLLSRADSAVSVDNNPLAAFPSLHVGVPAALAVWSWRHRVTWLTPLLVAQSVLIFFAVVYFGEHYAIDGAAGLVVCGCAALFAAKLSERIPDWQAARSLISRRLAPGGLSPAPAPWGDRGGERESVGFED